MLTDVRLPKKFWVEAISTAAYLVNCCLNRSLDAITPEEAWTQRKPNLQHLNVFGSTAMYHIPKQKRRKLDIRSLWKTTLSDMPNSNSKGYRIYDPDLQGVIISRDVVKVSEGEFGLFSSLACEQQLVDFMEHYTWIEPEEQIEVEAIGTTTVFQH